MVLTEDNGTEGRHHEVHCCKRDEADDVIQKLQEKARTQIDEGRLHDALQNLNKSLAMEQKLYGKKHPKVAATLNTMGEVLSNCGADCRYTALAALEESLEIRQNQLPPGSEDTAATVKNLWLLLHESNVAISSENEETTFQDFDEGGQVY